MKGWLIIDPHEEDENSALAYASYTAQLFEISALAYASYTAQLFEITIKLPNGDWVYWREECRDYQAACESGIASCASRRDGSRLLRVEVITSTQSIKGNDHAS